MTLGKKLAGYRKQLGITQQQLGERLNLSPQAVSKWENDLAEPDLHTLKALSNIYGVSIDEILDVNHDTSPAKSSTLNTDAVTESVKSAINEQLRSEPKTLGFCKECGITITEENLGKRDPVFKCKKCVTIEHEINEREAKARIYAEKTRALAEKERIKQSAAALEARKNVNRYEIKQKRKKSFIIAGLISAALFALMIPSLYEDFCFSNLCIAIILTYSAFSFVSLLFYDTPVTNVISYMCTASINWPGLIFTFDLDGLLWLIGMKILFAILGFLFGLLCSILGLVLGLIISPFVFPFIMVKMHRDIKSGVVADYIDAH